VLRRGGGGEGERGLHTEERNSKRGLGSGRRFLKAGGGVEQWGGPGLHHVVRRWGRVPVRPASIEAGAGVADEWAQVPQYHAVASVDSKFEFKRNSNHSKL
jgi:hypothetical protein